MANALTFLENSSRNRKLWLAAYAATLIIPWALIYGRGIADACCVLIGLLFLLHSMAHRQWTWLRDPVVNLALLTWVWLLFVVTPLAVQPDQSFMLAGPWIRYVLLYAALRHWVLLGSRDLKRLGTWLTIMLGFVAIDTVWQYLSGTSLTGNVRDETGRLTGPFEQVKVGIFAAKMLLPAMGIFLFFSLAQKQKYRACFAIAMLGFVNSVILLSGERTAFISCSIALGLTGLWFIITAPRQRLRLLAVLAAWLMGIGLITLTQQWVQTRSDNLYNNLSNFRTSPYGKLFRGGLMMGADHMFAGAGLRGFRELCPDLIEQGRIDYCNLHPHNPYIEWLAEAGLPGLLLFVAMVVLLARSCFAMLRQTSGIYRVPVVFALACLVQNFMPLMATQSTFSNWPGILLWYSISVSLAMLNALEKPATA